MKGILLTPTAAFSRTAPESSQSILQSPLQSTSSRWQAPRVPGVALSSTVLKCCGTAALPLMLSACSWSWFGLNPHAHTVPHPTGWLSVAPTRDFAYMPAHEGHMSPNRIENTAMTGIVLKSDINEAVRNGIVRQLKISGFHLTESKKVLSGTIEKFSVDDERSPACWTLKMRYVVTDTATQKVVFATTKTVRQKSPKFTSNTIAVEDTVKLSVDALIGDPAFVKSVN